MKSRERILAGAVVCVGVVLILFGARLTQAEAAPAFVTAGCPDSTLLTCSENPFDPGSSQAAQSSPSNQSKPTGEAGEESAPPSSERQPKRILGIMPNYRAVSAGEIPPPPTAKESFKIATENSFDYSSFIFVGMTSLIAEAGESHPQLGKGVAGFGRYYWRGFIDKTDGNYLVIFALPTILHEDERYYAMGQGGFFRRSIYSATRIFITPDYHGHNTVNLAEIFGRGISQGISTTYYPRQDRTVGKLATKYAYALGRDALTNVFREFWPDISTHLLHRQP